MHRACMEGRPSAGGLAHSQELSDTQPDTNIRDTEEAV